MAFKQNILYISESLRENKILYLTYRDRSWKRIEVSHAENEGIIRNIENGRRAVMYISTNLITYEN